MKDTGSEIAVAASDRVDDYTRIRADYLERARKLSRRLRVQVVIDDSGWLRQGVELVIAKETTRPIRAICHACLWRATAAIAPRTAPTTPFPS